MRPEDVRSAFVRRRRMIHPDYRDSKRWAVCWEKAAEFMEEHGVELDAYIEAQFEYKKPFPTPNHLYNQQAINRYETFIRNKDLSATVAVGFEVNHVNTRLNCGYSKEAIVDSEVSDLTVAGRFLFARKFGLTDLANKYEDMARSYIESSPARREAYTAIFGELPW